MGYVGYVVGLHGSVAPLLARDFELGDAEMARLFSWLGVASLATLALGRAADHLGRRRALLACAAALPVASAACALAPGPGAYLAAQLAAFGLATALLALGTVVLAEELPPTAQARGHGRAGLAVALGTALPLAATAVASGTPGGWRAVWAIGVLPILALPWLARSLGATLPSPVASSGAPPWGALLARTHRGDALRTLGAAVAIQGAEAAARAWLLYHPVRGLGLSPARATLLLAAGGALGLAGFRLGAVVADTRGRRAALLAGASLFAVGVAGYYGATPPPGVAGGLWLLASLAALAAGGNAALASFRAHAAELLPSPLRGTFGGLVAVGGALGWSASMVLVAALAERVGGVGPAVACVVLVALPAAALLLRRLPEPGARPSRTPRPSYGRHPAAHST